jgi:hypothetical protein
MEADDSFMASRGTGFKEEQITRILKDAKSGISVTEVY